VLCAHWDPNNFTLIKYIKSGKFLWIKYIKSGKFLWIKKLTRFYVFY